MSLVSFSSRFVRFLYLICLVILQPLHVLGLGQSPTIAFENAPGLLKLADSSSAVHIYFDSLDWPGALRAGRDVARDFGLVTGQNGSVVLINGGRSNTSTVQTYGMNASRDDTSAGVIIAGTIGKSALIDKLVQQGKISSNQGLWETYSSQVVLQPISGINSALVIAGSDKRGTIYGLYDISEQIGVSPWYYWADVQAKQHSSIYALPTSAVRGPPSVKYRGIFLNDEAPALTGFVNAKYPRGKYGPGYNADFYATVFELLLRLKANTLWPTMWDSMFNVDDERNQPLADEYGVVMGTSHTEPMMRSTKEWSTFGKGAWKWSSNKESIKSFLAEGARRAKPYESIFTLGMRGSGDTAMSPNIEKETLEDIVKMQREILKSENITDVEQVWCLYKEVAGYYDAGMSVPDDVTLLWSDDNWGNIRRLPIVKEKERKGGSGVYYHFDYVGDPRSYKWINTVILQKTWQQLRLAYEMEARKIWIVNVGDLKPLEIPINYFMDLAWNTTRWSQDPQEWLSLWAAREFDPVLAEEIARVAGTYSVLAGRRKFELVEPNTYSLNDYDEADLILAEWQKLAQDAQRLYHKIDSGAQAAFFEMVLHPALAGANFHKIQILSAKNNVYARQGRNIANAMADEVLRAFRTDHELSKRYNDLLGGKWQHMMDQTHLGYSYWQQPMRQMTPALHYVQTLEPGLQGDLGVAAESRQGSVPGDDQYHSLGSNTLVLPPYSTFSPPRWIDIFSTGVFDVTWMINTEPFVNVSQRTGVLSSSGNSTDVRIYVTVDWSLRPPPSGISMITITSSSLGGSHSAPSIALPYNYTRTSSTSRNQFVEADGHIAFEPWSYPQLSNPIQLSPPPDSKPATPANAYLMPIPNYGLTLAPFTTTALTFPAAPFLSVPFQSFSPLGNVSIILHFAPSLNTAPDHPIRYALSLDASAPPREVQLVHDRTGGELPLGWGAAVASERWESRTEWQIGPGEHSLVVALLDVGLVLKRVVVDFGGVRESGLGPPGTVWIGGER